MTLDDRTRPLSAESVRPGAPWLPVEVLDETGSTNDVLVADPQPWRVVVAERQTHGRGRLGRAWSSTPGLGLAVSVVVPATGMPLGWVPLTAGLALADAIEGVAGVPAGLKWPNDVLLPGDGERKVAGLLCAWTPVGVVVGTGVNVHHRHTERPVPEATSVALAGGETTREALLTAYLRLLADHARTLAADPAAVRAAYAARCLTIGRTIRVQESGGDIVGVATGVDTEGRLEVRTESGPRAIAAGDVVHVRPA